MLHARQACFCGRLSLIVVALLLSILLFMAGCGDGGETDGSSTTSSSTESSVSVTEPGPAGTSGDVALEVMGPQGTRSLTLDEVRGLQSTEGYGGMKSSTGRITPPTLVRGVSIQDLFADVGGAPADMAVNIVAKDGYEMTISVAQLESGDFLTYDMVTGDERTVDEPLQAIVAYEIDGQPIDPDGHGPLRLAIVSSERNQVTDGHWWVKWVTKLQVKSVEEEWTLLLTGALTEEMDRGTFETGAAEGCHGRDWVDEAGDTWTGIPLYLLVGRVDDDNVHEGPAYNRDLANAGYDVDIITSGSGAVTLSSQDMYYNKDLVVAYRLNGEQLPEEYWPLRLVGEGLEPDQMVGGIGEIKLLLPGL